MKAPAPRSHQSSIELGRHLLADGARDLSDLQSEDVRITNSFDEPPDGVHSVLAERVVAVHRCG